MTINNLRDATIETVDGEQLLFRRKLSDGHWDVEDVKTGATYVYENKDDGSTTRVDASIIDRLFREGARRSAPDDSN